MDMNRTYVFEADGICLDPEEPIRRFAHDWSFRIRVAKSDHGWHYGICCTCDNEEESHLPNEFHNPCQSLREAIYRAAMEVHGFFVKFTYTDDSVKRSIAKNAISRVKAIIRDYAKPSSVETTHDTASTVLTHDDASTVLTTHDDVSAVTNGGHSMADQKEPPHDDR